jgi:ATP-binding cassette, subfamily C (CFTR/MRP), member 10
MRTPPAPAGRSALDTAVAASVWRAAIGARSWLAAERRTRIVVSHDPRLAAEADIVVVMDAGRVVACGPPAELPQAALAVLSGDGPTSGVPVPAAASEKPASDATADSDAVAGGGGGGDEEERAVGLVDRTVLRAYVRHAGAGAVAAMLLSLAAMQLSRNACDVWLARWSAAATASGDAALGDASYLIVYGGLAGFNGAATLARSVLFAYAGLRAAVHVHDALMRAVVHAPLSWFSRTPVSRLVNRFSSDMYSVDEQLPFMLNIFLAQVCVCACVRACASCVCVCGGGGVYACAFFSVSRVVLCACW